MSKRGADEYITKEHGSTPNKQEESKVKMATAAQLAKRKIAAPKSRINRSNAGSPAPSNPFGGSAFGAPPPSQQTFGSVGGGVTFGQSQSFPPSGSTAGSDFAFSVPSQSTSFTFGQPVANNPFASLNGGTVQDENKPPEDTLMESPQKKPAFGSGAFGSTQNTATNGGLFAGFPGFGQPDKSQQQSLPQPSFGTQQNQINGFGSSFSKPLFGQSQDQAAANGSGNVTQPQNPFGQTATTQPTSTSLAPSTSLFGQSASQPKNPTFSFGQPISETPKSPFSFDQSTSQSSTSQTPKAPTFAFGQPAQVEAKSDTPKFLFGQSTGQPPLPATSTPAAMPASTSKTPGTLFGQSQNTPAKNLFSGFGSTKSDSVSTPPATGLSSTSASILGSTTTDSAASTSTAGASNPFAGLFAQSSKETSSAPSTETPKAVFDFAAPTQPKGIFGTPSNAGNQEKQQSSSESSAKALFGLKPAETTQTPTFSPGKVGSETLNATPAFGNQGVKDSAAEKADKTPAKSLPPFSFGQSAASKTPSTTEPKSGNGFSFGTPASATPTTPATSLKRPAPEPSQGKTIATPQIPNATASGQPEPKKAATTIPSAPAPSGSSTATLASDPQRTMYTNPPARIPPYLSAEKYKSYDSNYRLHSLNREFQRRIASLDPTKEDFENIVRTYVAARESIGESIGLYTRNIAGMKRKEDKMDDEDGPSNTVKKAKTMSASVPQSTPSKSPFADSVFQPVPASSQVGASSATNAASTAKAATTGMSSTSSLFKSMIPEQSPSKAPAGSASTNPFASLYSQTPNKATSGFNFGAAASQPPSATKSMNSKTTTPPSSPPKKVGFQPSFSATPSANDFMNAFKKQSEASSAKFAKEAMEKRKAEEFDSDEDNEEEWMRKYEDEQKAKRAKLGAFRGFTPSFENSDASDDNASLNKTRQTPKSPVNISSDEGATEEDEINEEGNGEDDEEAANEENDEDGDDEDEDEDSTNNQPLITNGKSIFDRISRDSDVKQDSTPPPSSGPTAANIFGKNLKATPDTPSFSPITPSSNAAYKPAATFNFTPTPKDSPTPNPGGSVFDGGFTKSGPIPGEGLFGSRSNTPVNDESTNNNAFGNLNASQSSAGEDHTWKKGSAIKFGSDTQTPAVNITAPSPIKETPKFGTLFGNGSATAGGAPSNSLGFSFGSSSTNPAPGFLSATSYLAPASGTGSGISSRATSPGATDNESVATNETDDAPNDPQSTLLAHSGPYPGEENEDVLFEARAKIFRIYKADEVSGTKKTEGWNVEGVGPMRVLKNKTSGKTRIVARAEPNANVVFNANVTPGVSYKAAGTNVVVPVFGSGAPVQWMVKVKTSTIATELASILESNKGTS